MVQSSRTAAAGQYAQVGLQTGVESASPHRLILMLMDGALARISAARLHMQRGEVAEKGLQITWAISIVEGLRGSLDLTRGGSVAANLDRLYEYMTRRLLHANLDSDANGLSEVYRLLDELRAGWVGIRAQVEAGGEVENALGSVTHAVG